MSVYEDRDTRPTPRLTPNRVVGHADVAPDQLLAHPENWRVHPRAQQTALEGVLDRVGWVRSVLVNQRTGHVVDGHLRVGLAISRGEETVPVDYVDLDQEEERVILAALDPLSTMAATDSGQLTALLSDLDLDDELEKLLKKTAGMDTGKSRIFSQEEIENREGELERAMQDHAEAASSRIIETECPECGHTFGVSI